jgi:hypothetical protein
MTAAASKIISFGVSQAHRAGKISGMGEIAPDLVAGDKAWPFGTECISSRVVKTDKPIAPGSSWQNSFAAA